MEFIQTEIEGLILIKPQVFGDNRGYFLEAYNHEQFKGIEVDKRDGNINFNRRYLKPNNAL